MNIKLFGYWRSSASWRVRWALELKKIPYNYIPVNILKGEHREEAHLRRNVMGALPVMEVAPETYLSQSMAILLWLEENFACEPMLFGRDRSQRYKIIEFCEIINADTAPLQTPRVQKIHSEDSSKKIEWARHFTNNGLCAFEKGIKSYAGKFCFGDKISAADLFLIPQMYNAKRFSLELNQYPLLYKIWDSCMATQECLSSSPENQIDALK
ncbi:MAG: maleylacetoacetate isomerase [Bdellovibrionota bacterium]